MKKTLQEIQEYIILLTIFLFPLAVSGIFIDQIQLPKLIVLVSGISLTLIVIAIDIFVTGKIHSTKSKLHLPVLLLMLAYLVSGIIQTPNKIEAFFTPGNATIIIALGILYFLANLIENKNKIKLILLIDAVLISITTLCTFLNLFEKISFVPTFVKSAAFNPTGDYISSTLILLVAIPFGVNFLTIEKRIERKLIYAFSVAIVLAGIGISFFTLFTQVSKNQLTLPPFSSSWDVAIETIKESPLFGAGPGNYLTSFNRFRAVSYNQTKLWQVRFSTGSNLYLTILTETGVFGAVAIIFLIFTILKIIEKSITIYKESHSITIDIVSIVMLISILIFAAIFPPSTTTLMLIFIILALNSKSTFQTTYLGESNTVKGLISVSIIAILGFFLIKTQPIVAGEYKFKLAYDALTTNNGKKTYDLLGEAINLNPYVDRYHASYAQVNLAIARSIVSNKKDPKDLSDSDKTTITQLIQQGIREGQTTVALNPSRAANWEVLGSVYQTIIPYANQADSFAIQSYSQTIALDPINPNYRITLGQIYYSLGRYSDAINTFNLAVSAKPDLANAHYNLAVALAANKQTDDAISEINKVLNLVPKNSSDYKIAKAELDTLNKKTTEAAPTNETTNLTTPEKSQASTPQITLPPDSSPPASPKLSTPSPNPKP